MTNKKKMSLASVIIVACWLIMTFLFSWSVLEMINITFIAGMIGLLSGAIIVIVNSGFASLFISGFRKISLGLNNSRAMGRVDNQVKNDPNIQTFKQRFKREILGGVFSFSLASISLSVLGFIIYY